MVMDTDAYIRSIFIQKLERIERRHILEVSFGVLL